MKSIYFLSFNISNFTPYAYGVLRAYAEQNPQIVKNYQWHEPLCEIEPAQKALKKIVDPDLLLCSCYIWNHENQMSVARKVKERYPQCLIVCGGPHIPEQSEGFFQKHPFIDILVHHEGEVPLENLLLEYLNETPDYRSIKGLSINIEGKALKTPRDSGLPKELPIPSPYLLGFFDDFIDRNKGVLALWETSRGCPFACSYCSWGISHMNRIKIHDIEKLKQEVEFIAKHKIREIHVSDANFGLLRRDLDITRFLVESKRKTGYPMGLRFNFAKESNEIINEISKLLHEEDMLWGTTLSMQSVDKGVQKAIKRSSFGIENYKRLKEHYNRLGIHTYTELILGLPLETRESFIRGICELFEIGIHEDIRVFELVLLPNAPLNQPSERAKYGLKTKFRPLHVTKEGCEKELAELVFETNTMPFEDWSACLLFAEVIQALHNGGYTRFLAIYLNDSGILSYYDFYVGFIEFALETQAPSLDVFPRIKRLIDDYYREPEIPQVHRMMSQPDIIKFLHSYNANRKAWKIYLYTWLRISENIDDFFIQITHFLKKKGVDPSEKIRDLIQYQKDIMLQLDYDPQTGKEVAYRYHWYEYFFNGSLLKKGKNRIRYTDTHMGNSHRYELVKNNRRKFLTAAVGAAWPYSKFRHFFHQPDHVITL